MWEVDYEWMQSRFASKTLMETPGIPSTRWFDATLLPKDQVGQPDTLKAMFIMGHGGNTITRMPQARPRHREARTARRVRSLSDHVVGALGAQERHLPSAGLHQLRDGRLAHGVEPLAAVGREDRGAGLRIEERLRHDVHARPQARLRRPDVQEHQGRERRGVGGGYSARDQSRRLVDRLLRPVAGAAQGAYAEPGEVRPRHDAGAEGRSGSRRRLLRPAVAVLGNAGVQAPRLRRSSTTPICR